MRFLSVVLLLSLCLPLFSHAATTGEHAAEFLSVGVGARAIGMGSTFAAIADDATAAYWNPAGLVQIPAHGFSAMYADVFEGSDGGFLGKGLVHYSFTNYVMRINESDAVGVSWIRMGVDDIPRTTFEDTNGNGVLGDFLDTNDNGAKDPGEHYLDRPVIAELFSNTDDALLLSYARQVVRRLSVGGNLKYVRQSIYENVGTGWGVDLAAIAELTNGLTTALVLRDALGTRISWDTPDAPTFTRKPSLHLGFAYQRQLPLIGSIALGVDARNDTADVDESGSRTWQIHYGAEYWLFDLVALRVGVAGTRFAAGAGLQLPLKGAKLRADYAFSTHELGDSQRLSITGQF